MQGNAINNLHSHLFSFFVSFVLISCGGGSDGGLPVSAAPDTTPPVITLIKPTPGSSSHQINIPIEIEFNENIQEADSNNILIRLYDSNNNVEYTGSVVPLAYPDDFELINNKLKVNPGTLNNDSKYQIIINGFKDTLGNSMLTQCQWDFATGNYPGTIEPLSSINCGTGPNTPDVTAPKVVEVTPTGSAVPITTAITVMFDEAIDESTLNSSIIISKIVNNIPEPIDTYDYNLNNYELTLIPNTTPSLDLNSQYQIKIGTGLLDTSGNALETEHIAVFKTLANIIDDVTPPLVSISPIENTTVDPSSDIIVRFNESMNDTTILTNIKLSQITVGDVLTPINLTNIYTYTYDVTRNEAKLSILQGQSLAFDSKYLIEVLTGVTDSNGNPLSKIKSSKFSTVAQLDVTPPEIKSSLVFPTKGSTVEPTINIVIPFNEQMKENTLQSNIFLSTLNGSVATKVTTLSDNYNYSYNNTTQTVTFTQSLPLIYSTNYRISVNGGSGGVQDKNGNYLVTDFTQDFITSPTPDTINPTVLKIVPTTGTTISVNKDIIVTFSEPMNPQTFTGNFKLYEIVQGVQSTELTFPFTINTNPSLTVVTLKTASNTPALLPGKEYRLIIKGLAPGILDTAGNEIITDNVTDFKTAVSSHQWTWMDGDNTKSVENIYLGISALPGNRYDATVWKNPNGSIWIFGGGSVATISGNSTAYLNDLWNYNPTTNRWTEISGNRTINSSGNYVSIPNTPLADVFPGGRKGAVSWFDTSGNLWLFGGDGLDSVGATSRLNDLWKYNLLSNKWTWISGSEFVGSPGSYSTTPGIRNSSNQPPARSNAISWIDNTGNLWLYGGSMLTKLAGEEAFSDLWKYIPQVNMWIWVSGSQLLSQFAVVTATNTTPINPGARVDSNYWKDNDGNFWLLGGYATADKLNGLWKFNPTTEKWLFVRGSTTISELGVYGKKLTTDPSNIPGIRTNSVTWVDSQNNFWLYGGHGFAATIFTGGALNDLWKFDGTSWTWMHGSDAAAQPAIFDTIGTSSTTTNPGSLISALGWIDSEDNLWLFGGYSFVIPPRNSLWKYTP